MSVTTEIQRLHDAKDSIKESIIGKNVEVPENATLDEYSGLVDQIKTGNVFTEDNIYIKFQPTKLQILNINGETYHYSGSSSLKLNKLHPISVSNLRWDKARFSWSGGSSSSSTDIWKSVNNIYLRAGLFGDYILDKDTLTWSACSISHPNSFDTKYVWNDGVNTYYSYGSTHRILDESTNTVKWVTKTWTGLTSFTGDYIWTDGQDIYYSNNTDQYVLDKETSTWVTKTWNLTSFKGDNIWTDGEDMYLPDGTTSSSQYILDKETYTWKKVKLEGVVSFTIGSYIWSDGSNTYYSSGSNQGIFDKAALKFNSVKHFSPSGLQGYIVDNNNAYQLRVSPSPFKHLLYALK